LGNRGIRGNGDRMSTTIKHDTYVSEGGNWGMDNCITFSCESFTELQWHYFLSVSESDRYDYARAVLDRDQETIARIEREN
jgi:hypothetical protein